MDRKEFIKTTCMACVSVTALATILQSCAHANYFAQASIANNRIIIRKTEFVKIGKEKTVQRKYVLVKTDKFNYPICVYKLGQEEYSALLLRCTHKGCELNPNARFLSCPCHGSEFTNTGEVQNPPAEIKLKTFKTRTDDENIYVQL
ncbi:MAG TPA: Rieske 2Fe-2S domain-containing protein [Saprospiraceae bacterium]|nr:Rieske 2Fe-2S domain-containing protein [Saprospiraceae bacterium]